MMPATSAWWQCRGCGLHNPPDMPGCGYCGGPKPDAIREMIEGVRAEFRQTRQTLQALLEQLEDQVAQHRDRIAWEKGIAT